MIWLVIPWRVKDFFNVPKQFIGNIGFNMSDSKLIFPAWMIFNFGETCFKFIFQKKIFLNISTSSWQ